MKINNYYVLQTAPQAPYTDAQSRIMIPLRSVSELLGAKVGYDANAKTATISMDSTSVIFTIGSRDLTVNGNAQAMDTTPVLKQNSMIIPVSVLAKHLGIESSYYQVNKLYSLIGEDVATYILTDDSAQLPNPSRARPVVKKDGIIEETIQNGTLKEPAYVLVKGRLLDR
ncbi:copper amine oxidase N-terminal domain-containing protein [Paenibacillus sp. 22594]